MPELFYLQGVENPTEIARKTLRWRLSLLPFPRKGSVERFLSRTDLWTKYSWWTA